MNDILRDLGPLALASRMRRLAERLQRGMSQLYDESAVDFEVRWFPVMYCLGEHSPIAVTAIAARLGYTHPAVNQILTAMSKAGLVSSRRDRRDERRRLVKLTPRGRKVLAAIRPLWSDVRAEALSMLGPHKKAFFRAVSHIEAQLESADMYERVSGRIKQRMRKEVEIVDYVPQYKKYFKSLNYQWLKEHFSIEPRDEELLSDPMSIILKPGGFVVFARLDGKVVGTAAVLKHAGKVYELTKMAVDKAYRGRQVIRGGCRSGRAAGSVQACLDRNAAGTVGGKTLRRPIGPGEPISCLSGCMSQILTRLGRLPALCRGS
jgi:DNA-binding MarR family transcriptional regulator